MEELLDEYSGAIHLDTLDQFISLFYKASDKQLSTITEAYDVASGAVKECLHDDGVQANMIRWLGEELILISLFHLFEKHIKEIIRYSYTTKEPCDSSEALDLHRWDKLKSHLPEPVKSSNDFQQVNLLRVLVNCFKHSGIVSDELYKIDQSFGNSNDRIDGDIGVLYKGFKDSVSEVIRRTYEACKT